MFIGNNIERNTDFEKLAMKTNQIEMYARVIKRIPILNHQLARLRAKEKENLGNFEYS